MSDLTELLKQAGLVDRNGSIKPGDTVKLPDRDFPPDIFFDLVEELFGTSTKKGRGLAKKTLQLRADILAMIDDDYIEPPFTVRQAFYRLTTLGAVEKSEAGYRRVQREILRLRREHEISYRDVADNTRIRREPDSYNDLSEALERTADFYRQALWRDIDAHVEIWCEKDALAGVMVSETFRYDVPLLCARGYSSETFAYEAAEEMRATDKPGYVYYFGDFDPSGWDMAENLEKKLRGFNPDIVFERVAVNPDQIADLNLPERPTKKTDTRHQRFAARFGSQASSVELDSIDPATLRGMVRECIEQHIPDGHLEAVEREERAARESLAELAETWNG